MIQGIELGLFMTVISLFLGVFIGIIMAFAAISHNKLLNWAATFYTAFFRNTPLLILVYIVYFGLPDIGIRLDKITSFIVTLAFYAGAYMTEVFRAGLAAIPKGIIEAGQTIGLTGTQIKLQLQLPIMFRNVLPSMSNYMISLFKDTSIAASITIPELTYQARKLNVETFRVFEAWITAAVLYVMVCYAIAFLLRQVEKAMKIP
jgi:polar amino acid transport system permease protein